MRRTPFPPFLASLSLAALSALVGSAQAQPAYRFTDLGAVGNFSIGHAINRHGSVAGFSSGKHWSATLWHHGEMRTLDAPSPELGNCQARGINGDATVVGECLDADSRAHAVQWQAGRATELPGQGGRASQATAVNRAGWVVGHSEAVAPGSTRATRWIDGTPTDLGTLPGGAFSVAQAINDKGQVAGYSQDRHGLARAVLWRNGKVIDLGTLGGQTGQAWALNRRGLVVGCSLTPRGHLHATLWDGRSATDLGTLPNGRTSCAHGINDAGVVVGYSFTTRAAKVDDRRATRWTAGTPVDLNTLLDGETRAAGWVLLAATAVNAQGQITGVATNRVRHDTRAFLLTPSIR